jgi:hypothetical protein
MNYRLGGCTEMPVYDPPIILGTSNETASITLRNLARDARLIIGKTRIQSDHSPHLL